VTGKAFFAVTLLKNLFVIAHASMVKTTKIIQINDTGAGAAPHRPAYVTIQISDSDDEDELRKSGAPSSD
jgi:hypothetical protein